MCAVLLTVHNIYYITFVTQSSVRAKMVQRKSEISDAVEKLHARGYAVLENLVPDDLMDNVASELARHFGEAGVISSNNTNRVHSRILANSPALQNQIVAPDILAILDEVLTPNCIKYQLSSIQGIEVQPGALDQGLHRDDDIYRLPHPHPVFEVNVMWAVTDFTEENGATRLIPNSHGWSSGRLPDEESPIQAAMPRGSALLWLGSTWHGAGANCTQTPRIGLYAGYSLGWLRQEETLYLALPPDQARLMPETLQRLIGYEIKGTCTLGWLDGRDPREVLGL